MKVLRYCSFICVFCLVAIDSLKAWGFFGHRKINELAVYTIPKPLFGFYKFHSHYMVTHATDADMRRYVLEEEACKHFLDGDHYEFKIPFDTLPRIYKKALEKYSEDTIKKHGIVPWHILNVVHQLTNAFKQKDVQRILKLSADLGHYVGDCHVPLHATSNYNGQKTGQKGIHALWESRLTELYFGNFNLFTGLATYIKTPSINVWRAIEGSYALVDSVLKIESNITKHFDDAHKYSWEKRGNTLVKVYSKRFCKRYYDSIGYMIESRLRASIIMLGSLIYTAWIDAGQPSLINMPVDDQPMVLHEKSEMKGREEE